MQKQAEPHTGQRPQGDDHEKFETSPHRTLLAQQKLPLILQPEGDTAITDYPAALERLAERVHDPFWNNYYVRILPQLHVIIWGRRRWV